MHHSVNDTNDDDVVVGEKHSFREGNRLIDSLTMEVRSDRLGQKTRNTTPLNVFDLSLS